MSLAKPSIDLTKLKVHLRDLASAGKHDEAIALLKHDLIRAEGGPDARHIRSLLIDSLVIVSKHAEANEHAEILAKEIGLRKTPPPAAWCFLLLILLLPNLDNKLLTLYTKLLSYWIVPKKVSRWITWEQLRSVQFAFFWHDIRQCPTYSIASMPLAATTENVFRSIGWFAYSVVYATGSSIAQKCLVKVVQQSQKLGFQVVHSELMPLAGIGYYQCHQLENALRAFSDFEKSQTTIPDFYRLLAYTVDITANIKLGRLQRAHEGLEKAFRFSMGLQSSRHYVQFYGARAAISAFASQVDEAINLLSESERVARSNDTRLDWIIYYRFESLVYQILDSDDRVRESVGKQNDLFEVFGKMAFDWYENRRMKFLLDRRRSSGIWQLVLSMNFIGRSIARMSWQIFKADLNLCLRSSFERDTKLISASDIAPYLKWRLDSDKQRSYEKIMASSSQKVTQCLLSSAYLVDKSDLSSDGLFSLIQSCFDPTFAAVLSTTDELYELLKDRLCQDSFNTFDPNAEIARMSCTGNMTFLAVKVPKTDFFREDLAVGMIISDLTFETAPALEAALKLVVTQFAYQKSMMASKEVDAKSREAAAVARMTQMLAHDVRKPFSILRMGLGMLSGAKDPTSVRMILNRLIPEIDKSVSSVDGLIADVMEVGSTSSELIQEPISPESLIEATLGEICRVYPKASFAIEYDFKHTHMSYVHVQKVSRVFSNIVGNAVQAMGQKGNIWFKTNERNGFIEFCVGNAGSVIPSESLSKLFDSFFTSGKKGGTGLGLAIAEKVVIAHGGTIWCESSTTDEHPEGKVEFFFTLPLALGHSNATTAILPPHSAEITMAILNLHENGTSTSLDKGELALEGDIARVSSDLGRTLRILVVDDEAIYRKALAAYLSRTPEMTAAIYVAQACGSDEAIAYLANQAFDLIITDVDMGADSLNGFDLVTSLRKIKGLSSMICVHSNRIVAADHRTAIASGADAFLPKPMARAQLLRLVLQSAQKAEGDRPELTAGLPSNDQPEILVVDDNAFILEAWEGTLKPDARVHVADSLEALELLLAADPRFIDRLAFVITDLHFDNSIHDGFHVAKRIKALRSDLPVLLSSDGVLAEGDVSDAFNYVIPKEPVGLRTLPMN